jgi:hypothetical protein
MDPVEKTIRIEALKNAIKYGVARDKVVIGRIMKDFPEYRGNIVSIKPKIDKIVAEINSFGKDMQIDQLRKLDPTAL